MGYRSWRELRVQQIAWADVSCAHFRTFCFQEALFALAISHTELMDSRWQNEARSLQAYLEPVLKNPPTSFL